MSLMIFSFQALAMFGDLLCNALDEYVNTEMFTNKNSILNVFFNLGRSLNYYSTVFF